MNSLDVIIAAAVVAGLVFGYRERFWVSALRWAGSFAAMAIAASLSPTLAGPGRLKDPTYGGLVPPLAVVGLGALVGAVSYLGARWLRRRISLSENWLRLDRIAGVGVLRCGHPFLGLVPDRRLRTG